MHMNRRLHDRLHHIHVGREDAESILVGVAPLLALLGATGLIAVVIRAASGKW